MSRIAALCLLLLPALSACAHHGPASEAALLEQRREWWKTPNHALLVDQLRPLEKVTGAVSTPMPTGDPQQAARLRTAALGAIGAPKTAALLVWHRGLLKLEYYGDGYDAAMLSAPASMPKPVLALAVGAAVDRGLLDIDVPVSRYIREWRGEARGAITVRQALQMRSGLTRYGPASQGGAGEALMLGTRLEALVLAAPLAGTPGARFDYNNLDNALVALVLQRATGMRYARWLSSTVWQPIGASDAFIWLDRPGGMARTFCCLLATPRDWVRIGRLIMNQGRWEGREVISSSWIEAMTAPSPTNPAYGFQIWRGTAAPSRSYGSGPAPALPIGEPYAVDDLLIFDGAVGQRVYISRKSDLIIVRIGEMAPDWHDSRLPNAILRALP